MFQLGQQSLGGLLKWLLKIQASGETMTEAQKFYWQRI